MSDIDNLIQQIEQAPKYHHINFPEKRYLEYDEFLDRLPANSVGLEFGVYRGYSIQYFAHKRQDMRWYGFDSFEGLPEDWKKSSSKQMKAKREFNLAGTVPTKSELHRFNNEVSEEFYDNVVLINGWFDKTLEPFIEQTSIDNLSFVNIDCDIYSSTKYVLERLNKYIRPGCHIRFDEIGFYENYKDHEVKALFEWLTEFDRKIEVVYTTTIGENVGPQTLVKVTQ